MTHQNVLKILDKHRGDPRALISILEEIQTEYGYLPEEALRIVAEETGRSLVDIYGVATFYRAFSLKPRGRHLISVCLGTACHVRGGPVIAQEFSRQLGVAPGETTPDKEFSLHTVNCLGACALGPIVVCDGRYYSNVHVAKVAQIISETRDGAEKKQGKHDPSVFPIGVNCPHCNHGLMDHRHTIDGHPSIRVTVVSDDKHGWVRLSSLYGSPVVESEYDQPRDQVFSFFCPHCHAELNGPINCERCQAPMVPMIVKGGGVLQICSRRGCSGHRLDLEGLVS
jgi:NADH:ubiquinone oxidoreductase subunit E